MVVVVTMQTIYTHTCIVYNFICNISQLTRSSLVRCDLLVMPLLPVTEVVVGIHKIISLDP